MTFLQRRVGGFVLLFALMVAPGYALLAQDNNTINVSGSGIVAPAFQAIADASGTNAALNVTVNGTNAGISALCTNTTDVALANRPLTQAEEQQCIGGAVNFVELVIGYDATVFVTAQDNDFLQCLTQDNLNAVFAPSASGQINTWDQVGATFPANPIAAVVPAQNTLPFVKLDSLVNGDGVRSDAQRVEDDNAVMTAVAGDTNALGVVTFDSLLRLNAGENAGVKAVQYTNPTLNTCVTPSVETLNDRTYPLADRLFVYINAASLEKPGLRDLLNFALSNGASAPLSDAGYVPASAEIYTTGQESLTGNTTGRVFSREVTAFTIPEGLSGTLNIAGAAQAFDYTQSLTQSLSGVQPGLTVTTLLQGVPAGARRFCNGEVEVLLAYGELTEEQTTNCAANNITPQSFNLGKEAVVLVGNGNTAHLACLTTEQITNVVTPKVDEAAITIWNQVAESFPETPILLLAPEQGNDLSDLLTIQTAGRAIPVRDDAEENSDVLYRAAAVANVEGALTYMSWNEYQQVLENNQERIQLIGVDAGSGCVTPSLETINDGSYVLTNDLNLVVSQTGLQNNLVQSLLWFIFSDANYSLIEGAGIVGISFGELPAVRDALQTAFNEAAEVPEATGTEEPGATAEAGATAEVIATEDASATTEAVVTEEASSATDEPALTEEVTVVTEEAATDEPAVTEEAAITEEATPTS
jgi:phosphate transport system substrate-binding protein